MLILKSYYSVSKAFVVEDNFQSNLFRTTIGVKQGGPLSPRLFSLYIEEIINSIENTTNGVKIGDLKIDILL